jgi:hypothetical protein
LTHDGQPEPARPYLEGIPVWLRPPSQLSDAERRSLLTAKDKANTSTAGLQRALTALALTAVALALIGLGVFQFSHFRVMDVMYGTDAAGHRIGFRADYTAWGIALFVVVGALLALAGHRLDVGTRTRVTMMTAGSAALTVTGSCVGLFLVPSRADLRAHYHVGEWDSPASFSRLIRAFDACGWLIAACGVAILVLMLVQRHKIAAAYRE